MYGNRLKWFLKYGFCKKLLSDVLHSQFLPHTSDLDQNKSEVSSVSVPFLTLIVLLSQFLPNTSDLDQNKSEVCIFSQCAFLTLIDMSYEIKNNAHF